MLSDSWFFELKKNAEDSCELNCHVLLGPLGEGPTQQPVKGGTHCGDSPAEPVQWHWLWPGHPQHSSEAETRHCLAGGTWFLGSPLGLGSLRADSQHQPASSASGRAGWVKKREWNLDDRAGQGRSAWGVFCKPAWTDSSAVSKGFHHCKEIEMIEWILMGNIEKQCIQAQFQGMAGKWMPQASSFFVLSFMAHLNHVALEVLK